MELYKYQELAAALCDYENQIRSLRVLLLLGGISPDEFIGRLNLYFDLAWGDVHGYDDD